MAWARAGSTMFLSANEQVSVENLLRASSPCRATTPSVVLAECIAGTEQAFTDQMNALAKRSASTTATLAPPTAGPTMASPMSLRATSRRSARAEIEHHPKLYKEFYSLPSFTWGRRWVESGHHPAKPQPDPWPGRGRGRAQDRPHRRGRLWLHRLGRSERTPPDRSRRRPGELECARPGIDPADPMGVRRVDGQALVPTGDKVGTATSKWAARAPCRLVAPRNLAVTVPAGLAPARPDQDPLRWPAAGADRQGPGSRRSWSSRPATRRRRSCPWSPARTSAAPAFLAASGSASNNCSGWRDSTRSLHQPRGRQGVGKSTQAPALAEALAKRGLEVVVTREPGGSDGAERIRELLLGGSDERWGPQAEALLFAAARADHVEKTIRPALEAGRWVLSDRFVDSSLAYQGGAGGLGIEAVRAINGFGIGDDFPDRSLVLSLDEGGERARARDTGGSDRIGGRPDDYHRKVDRGVPHHRRRRADPSATGRCLGRSGGSHRRLLDALADLLP